jgi:hypothetical protein
MNRLAVLGLRILLVLLFIAGLFPQLVVIPSAAAQIEKFYPDRGYLELPYTVLGILAVACGQVAIIAIWMLLSRVRRGAIFTERAFLWVDVIIWCGVVATGLVAFVEFHSLGAEDIGNPPVGIFLTGSVVAGAAFVLLMIVMRGLLRTATTLQSELEEVV